MVPASDLVVSKRDTRGMFFFVSICIGLVLMTAVVYAQMGGHGFINFDDGLYVFDNPHVKEGITRDNLIWAFSLDSMQGTYWHPLTWLSHLADVELFGLNPGRHHLISLLFHVCNVLLLFIVLYRMTGAIWRSAFVSALFALHPVNVDAVAWLAERKTLVSSFFWMMTLLAYTFYVTKMNVLRYCAVLSCYVLGLLAKPMLVTLPFVLLLLDFWPLKRFSLPFSTTGTRMEEEDAKTARDTRYTMKPMRLVMEKIPLLVLALASVAMSILSYRAVEASETSRNVPFLLRMENAVVSYLKYFEKMVWPHDLTFYYPFPHSIPAWKLFLAMVFLAAISLAALRMARRAPYIMVGWLWYLGTLVPVLGLMRAGLWPEIGERWAYVPYIGLFIAAAWGIPEGLSSLGVRKPVIATVSCMVLGVCMFLSWIQVGYWKTSQELYAHAIKVNPNNFIALNNMGNLKVRGKDYKNYKEGMMYYREAIRVNPNYILAYVNLGTALYMEGQKKEAAEVMHDAIKMAPRNYNALSVLGDMFAEDGRYDQAKEMYIKALKIKPSLHRVQVNLGNVLLSQGDTKGADFRYREALRINPYSAEAYYYLGCLELSLSNFTGAIEHLTKALKIDGSLADANLKLRMAYAHMNKKDKGMDHH